MTRCLLCAAALPPHDWYCPHCAWQPPLRDGIVFLLDGDAPSEGFTSSQIHDVGAIDPGHFWIAARNGLILWALRRYVPSAHALLEVGCGTGHVLGAIARARPDLTLTGAEVSLAGLTHTARAAPTATLLCADIRHLPFEDEFDVACAFDVLEHIPDHGHALRTVVRAVKPGGAVLITVPQHRFLWSPLDDYSGHQRRYRRSELVALARDAGLEVLRATSFVSLLLPAMLLSRLLQRRVAVTPGREFVVSGRVNAALAGLMRVERAGIEAGISWPAGGSLLLVGRRPARPAS